MGVQRLQTDATLLQKIISWRNLHLVGIWQRCATQEGSFPREAQIVGRGTPDLFAPLGWRPYVDTTVTCVLTDFRCDIAAEEASLLRNQELGGYLQQFTHTSITFGELWENLTTAPFVLNENTSVSSVF